MAAKIDESSNSDRIQELKEFENSKIGTKGLTESGITSIPKMFIHSPELLVGAAQKPDFAYISIPTIDLSGISDPALRPEIVTQMREAASTWGIFNVVNHGIPQSIIDTYILAVKNFHDQPYEFKRKYYTRDIHACVKYLSNEALHLSEVATWHDSLQVITSMPDVGKLDPMDIPEVCRREVLEWDMCAKGVAEAILEVLSEGLGLSRDRFEKMGVTEGRSQVAHYYPHCPQPELTLGLPPHSDPLILTVVLQDGKEGLQVMERENDKWLTVKPVAGALTINIGRTLQLLSNGKYHSVRHRVLANAKKDPRIAVATFFMPIMDKSSIFEPLPELLSAEKPALYTGRSLLDIVGRT